MRQSTSIFADKWLHEADLPRWKVADLHLQNLRPGQNGWHETHNWFAPVLRVQRAGSPLKITLQVLLAASEPKHSHTGSVSAELDAVPERFQQIVLQIAIRTQGGNGWVQKRKHNDSFELPPKFVAERGLEWVVGNPRIERSDQNNHRVRTGDVVARQFDISGVEVINSVALYFI